MFWDAERRILIAADHLIAHISSNPLISAAARRLGRAPAGARDLPRLAARDPRAAGRDRAPGPRRADHRPPPLIDERLALHQRRAEKILDLIAERPRTGYEIAQELWGNVAVTQAFLTLSEVIGHVDLLIDAGAYARSTDGEVVRYEAAANGEGAIQG